ncbi:ABC transporter substrate-binding protein [Hoeflea sp.]|uniref:ABC transporter substrate-binding protein n=1 Tax=Hoeflea sp. TaxID=1940281 RepID=UPI002AFEBC27|nr:ABC transporter substrate-binding protein [Hoeflea sp.]
MKVATLIRAGMLALATAAAPVAHAADMKTIAISTIVEVPSLMDGKQGIIDALADRGYIEGESLQIEYQNANGSMPTQQQIAKKFVGNAPDVIVPITTPTAQAMVASTKDIPIVFVMVTDPLKAKLIERYEQPGANVTGVSDAAPIGQQLNLMLEFLPDMKTVGFVYNPGLDNALAALAVLKEEAEKRNLTVVESAAPTTNEVILATKKLIGKVDAVYVPDDTTVVAAMEAIVKIGWDVKMPIFSGETSGVERGAAASVGLNYYAVGRLAGDMVADVLDGKPVGTIDAVIAKDLNDKFETLINKSSAEKMGLTVPQSTLDAATKIFE